MGSNREITDSDRIELLDEWSSGRLAGIDAPASYQGPLDVEGQYRTAKGRSANPVTLGTVYKLAREHGYDGLPPSEPPHIIGNAAFDHLFADNDEYGAGTEQADPSAGGQSSNSDAGKEQSSADKDPPKLFPIFRFSDLDKIPDIKWTIDDVLTEAAVWMLYGESQALKTFIAIDIASHGALKRPWAEDKAAGLKGFKIARPLRTALVAGEGARGIKKRAQAWCKRHGVALSALSNIALVPGMPIFKTEGQVETLADTIRSMFPKGDECDLVIIDTLMLAATGWNILAPADSQLFWRKVRDLRELVGKNTSVLVLHHTTGDGEKQLGAYNNVGQADHVDKVQVMDEGVGYKLIKVINEKNKDEEKRRPVYLKATAEKIGDRTDDEGGVRPVTSLVLQRVPEPPKKGKDDGIILGKAFAPQVDNSFLDTAVACIKEAGPAGVSERQLSEAMALRILAVENPKASDGEKYAKAESIRKTWLGKARTGVLAAYANQIPVSDNKAPIWNYRWKEPPDEGEAVDFTDL